MKKHLSILCVLAAMLSSCGIVSYVGIDPHAAPINGENTRYISTIKVASNKEVYVLGIGGEMSSESAIREAIENANLKEGEELVNMTCVSNTRFIPFTWLPIVVIRGYTVTADKISHNMDVPAPPVAVEKKTACPATPSNTDFSEVDAILASTAKEAAPAPKTVQKNDVVIGHWIVTNDMAKYDIYIIERSGRYLSIENGRERPLIKKKERYYFDEADNGEYYKISNGYLRLCDRKGDFTDSSGYKVEIVKN